MHPGSSAIFCFYRLSIKFDTDRGAKDITRPPRASQTQQVPGTVPVWSCSAGLSVVSAWLLSWPWTQQALQRSFPNILKAERTCSKFICPSTGKQQSCPQNLSGGCPLGTRGKKSVRWGPRTAESRATTGATEQQQLLSNYFINLSLFSETLFPKQIEKEITPVRTISSMNNMAN